MIVTLLKTLVYCAVTGMTVIATLATQPLFLRSLCSLATSLTSKRRRPKLLIVSHNVNSTSLFCMKGAPGPDVAAQCGNNAGCAQCTGQPADKQPNLFQPGATAPDRQQLHGAPKSSRHLPSHHAQKGCETFSPCSPHAAKPHSSLACLCATKTAQHLSLNRYSTCQSLAAHLCLTHSSCCFLLHPPSLAAATASTAHSCSQHSTRLLLPSTAPSQP